MLLWNLFVLRVAEPSPSMPNHSLAQCATVTPDRYVYVLCKKKKNGIFDGNGVTLFRIYRAAVQIVPRAVQKTIIVIVTHEKSLIGKAIMFIWR